MQNSNELALDLASAEGLSAKVTPGVFRRIYHGVDDVMRYALMATLVVMSLLLFYQIFARYLFDASSTFSEELIRVLLVWCGILGAAHCFVHRRHLNLPLLEDALSKVGADRLHMLNNLLAMGFGVAMVIGGQHAMVANADMMSPMLQVSIGALQSVLLISGALIVLSQIVQIVDLIRADRRNVTNLIGALLLLGAVGFAWNAFSGTATYETLINDHLELTSTVLMFGLFFLLMTIGTPIALALVLSGLLTLSLQTDGDALFSSMSEKMFNGLDSIGFLALPFFVLAGNIMNEAGIARRLIDLALLFGKRIPGSLWQTNVIANMLFGSVSGSGVAAATAIGGIVNPIAREKGYDMAMGTAVNASTAPSGMLIPPTTAFIVYALLTGGAASVVALFLAGYVPGIIMGGATMIVAYFYAKKHNYPVDKSPYVMSEVMGVLARSFPCILLIIIIIGGILGGAFTATEASGIAVLYSAILALVYRKLTWATTKKLLSDTVVTTGVILFLIACSGVMSWSMTFASIPDTIAQLLMSISDNKYVILLIINIMLLIVGVFMDMAPAQLIFIPILFPIVTELGVDPVHFGVILTYNLAMGVVTPPVGTVLFVSCNLTGEKITTVTKKLLPIFALQIVGLMLITYIPAISLTLPRLLGAM